MTNREHLSELVNNLLTKSNFYSTCDNRDDKSIALILSELVVCRDCSCANGLYDCKYLDCYEGILEYLKEHGDKEYETCL